MKKILTIILCLAMTGVLILSVPEFTYAGGISSPPRIENLSFEDRIYKTGDSFTFTFDVINTTAEITLINFSSSFYIYKTDSGSWLFSDLEGNVGTTINCSGISFSGIKINKKNNRYTITFGVTRAERGNFETRMFVDLDSGDPSIAPTTLDVSFEKQPLFDDRCASGDHDYYIDEEKEVVTYPTCIEPGKKAHRCVYCNSVVEETIEAIPALGHSYGKPTYTWADDYSTVTATRICKKDNSHTQTETVKTTSTVVKKATYTAKGQTKYTAKFSNTAFGTKSKTVTDIPKLAKVVNTMTAKGKTVTVKYSALKNKKQTILAKNAFTVKNAKGKVTYKKTKGNSKIIVSSAGKVTVKKGLKKGTYKVKVKVKAAGTTKYKPKSKAVTLTITVK